MTRFWSRQGVYRDTGGSLLRRDIPSNQTLENLKRLRYSSVWLDGISHRKLSNGGPNELLKELLSLHRHT